MTITITDIITLASILFLIWKGSIQGFLGSLLGPLALILTSIVSIVYYLLTKDLIVSLCIGLFGPFILTWIFRFFLHSWNQINNPEKNISLISRLSGALLSLVWGMTLFIITLLLVVMIPPVNKPLQVILKDIHASYFYSLIKPLDSMASNKPKLSPQESIQQLSNDQRIQDILHDAQITAAINRKDYAFLMSNPKITALMQDPEMIKKMLSLYGELPKQQQNIPKD